MRVLAATMLCLALLACDRAPPEPRVTAEQAWVILPPVPGRPASAYFTLSTNNDPTKLVSVTSPQVERVELHETVTENGVSRMRPAADLTFDDRLEFKAGGRHAMLFGIDPAVKPGGKIALTFTFEPAPPVTVEAEVRGVGGDHAGH